MEHHFSAPKTPHSLGGSQGSSHSSTSLYLPSSQQSQSYSQSTPYFSPPYNLRGDGASQPPPTASPAMSTPMFTNATQTTLSLSASQPPLHSIHRSQMEAKQVTPYASQRSAHETLDGSLAKALSSNHHKPAMRSYMSPSRQVPSRSTNTSTIPKTLQGTPRMAEVERASAIQSLQDSAAFHSMLDGTRDAIAHLHQLYTDGFSALKDQMTSLMLQQATSTKGLEDLASLRSQTTQLSNIASELEEIKQSMEKGTKLSEIAHSERSKDETKLGEVLSMLGDLDDRLGSMDKKVSDSNAAITKTFIPEHKKLSKEMRSCFEDVTSSLQEIVDEALKPLNESVFKAMQLREEGSRQREAENARQQVVAHLPLGPTHSSVTCDTVFEDRLERQNESLTSEITQSTMIDRDPIEDWFSKFLRRMDASKPSTTQLPIASSQAIASASQVSTASSWFEDMDDANLFFEDSAQGSSSDPLPPLTSQPSQKPQGRRSIATRTDLELSESQEEGTYWDLSNLEPRRKHSPSQLIPALKKKGKQLRSAKKASSRKAVVPRYATRSSTKTPSNIVQLLHDTRLGISKSSSSSSPPAKLQATPKSGHGTRN